MTLSELALVTTLWAVWVLAIVVLLRGYAELHGRRGSGSSASARVEPRARYTDAPLKPARARRLTPAR